jgi:hypothetical protein
MKQALPIMVLLFSVFACAMGSKQPVIERKDQSKMWRPCQDFVIQYGSPIGKLCTRTCINRDGDKCNMWNQKNKDFNNKDDFEFFRDGSFVFISEDSL